MTEKIQQRYFQKLAIQLGTLKNLLYKLPHSQDSQKLTQQMIIEAREVVNLAEDLKLVMKG